MLLSSALTLLLQAPSGPAGEIAFHPYRRAVEAGPGARRLVALPLGRDLLARARPDLADLVLVDAGGRVVPYRIEEARLIEKRETRAGRLVSVGDAPRRENHWTADFGEGARYDLLAVDVDEPEFARDVVVEGSDDLERWTTLANGSLFRRSWRGGLAERTSFDLEAGVAFRYVRVTSTSTRVEPPLRVSGMTVRQRWTRVGADVRWAVPVREAAGAGARRGLLLDLEPGVIVDRLEAETAEPLFRARISVRARASGEEAAAAGPLLASGDIFRVSLGSRLEEKLAIEVGRRVESPWILDVDLGDSPPLPDLRWFAVGPSRRLLFVAGPGTYHLYYGRDDATARRFDIADLPIRPDESIDLPEADLGPEEPNPSFEGPPAFAAETGSGASVEVRLWRFARALPGGEPGPVDLVLEPEDVAALRPDLADLRIVDRAGRQVPYLLDPRPLTRVLDAAFEEAPSARRGSQTLWIRPRSIEGAIPIDSIRLSFGDASFSRRFDLFAVDASGRERLSASGMLARPSTLGAGGAVELGVPTSGPVSALRLAIDNGDNAPLSLRSAEVVTSVRRVAYSGTREGATLLLGNPRATAPRYDVAVIAPDLLTTRARRVTAGPRVPGSAFAPAVEAAASRGVDRVALWAILGLSVLALLGLTVRLLRDQAR